MTSRAHMEKKSAAVNSVVAAVFLTSLKISVGWMTGSLGILAEAAHSGLDMVAALITWLAVRISDKPADQDHLYGHGKVENLSALFETILLLATCVWIIHEAYDRLFVKSVAVEASVWAFLVMAVSIVVDISRSKMLYKAAREHKSQALEADALHFRTDIWSSAVVILGLFCVKLSDWFPSAAWLQKADAIAALGVALIVIFVSMELGLRTLRGLLDTAPKGMVEQITRIIAEIPGVWNCHRVRVRDAGARTFVDAHVLVDGTQSLEAAHRLTDQIEAMIRSAVPDADVTVHAEPFPVDGMHLDNESII